MGTSVCHFGDQTGDRVDGVLVLTIDVTCELRTNGPRASGTERVVLVDRVLDPDVGAMWTADGVLTASEGTWRGTASGAVDQGNLPALQGYATWPGGSSRRASPRQATPSTASTAMSAIDTAVPSVSTLPMNAGLRR